jgi:hypothetical protein
MKKIHLTRYAAMASIALMGTSAAWGQHGGTGWSTANGDAELQLFSSSGEELVSISQSQIDDYLKNVKTIAVRRVDPAAEFSTLMLPVTVKPSESENIVAAYYPTGYNSYTQTMDFTEKMTIEANKPYLVRVSGSPNVFAFQNDDGYTIVPTGATEHSVTLEKSCWEFTGTYETIHWETSPGNVYGYASTDGKFVKAGNNVTIYPLRAYLTCNNSTSGGLPKVAAEVSLPDVINVRFLDKDGGTLSIGKMNTRTGEIQMQDRYYDLKGRKLNGKPQNKIMYVNKKVIKH